MKGELYVIICIKRQSSTNTMRNSSFQEYRGLRTQYEIILNYISQVIRKMNWSSSMDENELCAHSQRRGSWRVRLKPWHLSTFCVLWFLHHFLRKLPLLFSLLKGTVWITQEEWDKDNKPLLWALGQAGRQYLKAHSKSDELKILAQLIVRVTMVGSVNQPPGPLCFLNCKMKIMI